MRKGRRSGDEQEKRGGHINGKMLERTSMIDGGSEELEQEFISYLLTRRYTTAAE